MQLSLMKSRFCSVHLGPAGDADSHENASRVMLSSADDVPSSQGPGELTTAENGVLDLSAANTDVLVVNEHYILTVVGTKGGRSASASLEIIITDSAVEQVGIV